jgi:hypothetical protein
VFIRPFRHLWDDVFPDVLIHSPELVVKSHSAYKAAKAGDVEAAINLVSETLNDDVILELDELGENKNPILISVHAEEAIGVNAIPEVMADVLATILEWEVEQNVVQANVVNHTGAGGFTRIARQAIFEGAIVPGRNYLIVDDFIGQGGTIANLRGHKLKRSYLGARRRCHRCNRFDR